MELLGAVLVFNEAEDMFVLLGGGNAEELNGDVWAFDGEEWTYLAVNYPNAARWGHVGWYVPLQEFVVFTLGFNTNGTALHHDYITVSYSVDTYEVPSFHTFPSTRGGS